MKKSEKQLKKPSKEKLKVQPELNHVPVELRKLVADDVKRYLDILGMNHYKHRILYASKECEGDSYEMCGNSAIAASTSVDMKYLSFDIRVYPFMVDQWKKGSMQEAEIHDVIAHEVAHVATNHLHRMSIAIFKDEDETIGCWEALTTTVGRLINKIEKLQDKALDK